MLSKHFQRRDVVFVGDGIHANVDQQSFIDLLMGGSSAAEAALMEKSLDGAVGACTLASWANVS